MKNEKWKKEQKNIACWVKIQTDMSIYGQKFLGPIKTSRSFYLGNDLNKNLELFRRKIRWSIVGPDQIKQKKRALLEGRPETNFWGQFRQGYDLCSLSIRDSTLYIVVYSQGRSFGTRPYRFLGISGSLVLSFVCEISSFTATSTFHFLLQPLGKGIRNLFSF